MGAAPLKTAATLLCAVAAACAAPRPADAPVAAVAKATTGPTTTSIPGGPPVALEAGAALGLGPGEGEVVVRTDVLRGHPVGAHAGSLLGMWPGWRETLRAIVRDPLTDLDWIDVVGPSNAARARMLAGASDVGDPAVVGRLVALQARSAEPAASHVEGNVPAAAARLDGVLRILFRPEGRVVAAAAATRGPALSHTLLHAHVSPPALWPHEVARADLPRPHGMIDAIPEAVLRLRGRVLVAADGDADATAEGECATAQDAGRVASALRERVARENNPIVRMLTRGLLDAVAISVRETTVRIHVPANRDQLEALLTLVTASMPAVGANSP